jgi:hypothetical protein
MGECGVWSSGKLGRGVRAEAWGMVAGAMTYLSLRWSGDHMVHVHQPLLH